MTATLYTPESVDFDAQLISDVLAECAEMTPEKYDEGVARYRRRPLASVPITAPLSDMLEIAKRWGAGVEWDMSPASIASLRVGECVGNAAAERDEDETAMAMSDSVSRKILLRPLCEMESPSRAARILSHELIHTTILACRRPVPMRGAAQIMEELVAESGALIMAEAMGYDCGRDDVLCYLVGFALRVPEQIVLPVLACAISLARAAASLLLEAATPDEARGKTQAALAALADEIDATAVAA